ncbi:protein kintoun [Lampris incognitus]|uniref:protein kintoun n=1 Tax=Lampris incognitus TaxID=2546036 RepID=UPI0024B563A8|nr:protein kintoun [Lampris incognitus]
MEAREKLKDLNMTADEVERFTKAFKDETFRGMLLDYAKEVSDPENKKKYEKEIKQLEEGKGNSVDFIHPEPFRALRTSLNGEQKCFINICANGKVGKPEFNWGVSEDGSRGQHWSLPHSLHPGRPNRDRKGNSFMIFDVIFHPDTLHIASKNKRFMDMVDDTAIQGIQGCFKVILDKNNVRELSIKYKGTPQPCVIRKPIPGYKAKEPSAEPDPLAYPYPDEQSFSSTAKSELKEVPRDKNSGDKPLTFKVELQKPKEPTVPNYTLKHRSFIDLQDFRCSRDSAQSPRPKEIVVTIDMPLLKTARDTTVEVKGKSLWLESIKPAYRLEVPLAYPVDEDKGQAKFNKQKGQLTITLPVLPSKDALDFVKGLTQIVGNNEKEEEEENGGTIEKLRDHKREDGLCEEEDENHVEDENWKEQNIEGEKIEEEKSGQGETNKWEERRDKAAQAEGSCATSFPVGTVVPQINLSAEENELEPVDNSMTSHYTEDKSISALENNMELAKLFRCIGEEEGGGSENVSISSPQIKTSELNGDAGMTAENDDYSNKNLNKKMELDASPLNQIYCENSQTPTALAVMVPGPNSNPCKDGSMPQRITEIRDTPELHEGRENTHPTTEVTIGLGAGVEKEDMDEDDLQVEQTFAMEDHNEKPLPVLLREIDENGEETVICDHSTRAGFAFQNSLLYELD